MQSRYLKQIEFFRFIEAPKNRSPFFWYEIHGSQAALDIHIEVVNPAFQKEVGPPPEGLTSCRAESETYREIAR